MDRSIYRRGLASLMLAASLTAGLNPTVATGDEPRETSAGPPLRASAVRGSLAYLTDAYGIGEAEARRRLELQRAASALGERLAEALPDDYGGMWLDHAHGGVLMVAMVRADRLTEAVRTVPDRAHIKAAHVQWSLRQLDDSAQRVRASLDAGTDKDYDVVVDPQANRVVVWRRIDALMKGREPTTTRNPERIVAPEGMVADAVQAEQGRVVVKQLLVAEPHAASARQCTDPHSCTAPPAGPTCDPRYCGPPMRGGMRLDVLRTDPNPGDPSPGYWGACSNGFNVYSHLNGWNFIMTAGHCMTGPYKVGQNKTYSQRSIEVGYEVFLLENGPICNGCSTYPVDYSIQPFQTGSGYNQYDYWLGPYPKNQVVSYCWWSESAKPCTDGSFAITRVHGYDAVNVGWVVCATGSSEPAVGSGDGWRAGTRCGQVTGKDGGIVTNICSRPGDSGGPLFSEFDNAAYGILYGSPPGGSSTGPCKTWERSQYSPVSRIMDHVRQQTLRDGSVDFRLAVRTWP